jgi:thiol-disulfide isomerase/thioredoxin
VRVTLLTQTECGFCDQADDLVQRLAGEYPLDINTVDIASAAGQQLAAEGGIMFPPGILLDDEPVLYGRPSERRLRREIERRLGST